MPPPIVWLLDCYWFSWFIYDFHLSLFSYLNLRVTLKVRDLITISCCIWGLGRLWRSLNICWMKVRTCTRSNILNEGVVGEPPGNFLEPVPWALPSLSPLPPRLSSGDPCAPFIGLLMETTDRKGEAGYICKQLPWAQARLESKSPLHSSSRPQISLCIRITHNTKNAGI